ncbi:hypothetical protein K1719_008902 [Acacia pycnantha]|nr:hypothetical protein K1719_008902 [Acacia pycnantha]
MAVLTKITPTKVNGGFIIDYSHRSELPYFLLLCLPFPTTLFRSAVPDSPAMNAVDSIRHQRGSIGKLKYY